MSDIKLMLRETLIALSAEIAAFRDMALIGEGNVSAHVEDGRILVSASGTRLSALRPEHLIEVDTHPLLQALDGDGITGDEEMEALLMGARTDPEAMKPSVESLIHAWLLQLEGIRFVAHAHPVAVTGILCSPHAEAFAGGRLFPDQVVYCGRASVRVPYVDPGLVLARTIANHVTVFQADHGVVPKTILLENHGLIAIGHTAQEARAALFMMEKAARVFLHALSAGGPIFMEPHQVSRIDGRIDEHYRQRMLHDS